MDLYFSTSDVLSTILCCVAFIYINNCTIKTSSLLHNFIHSSYNYFKNFITNTLNELHLNPLCNDKFHLTPLDKESFDNGSLTKANLVTWKSCTCLV